MPNINLFFICLGVLLRFTNGERYTVPPARIEVLHPKGFSVSIPDTPGIQLFAFHGNLNSPMEGLEAGQFSADILKHKNGRWTFTDKKHEIKLGDTLYYWLYVQKDSTGFRRDDQKHTFAEHEIFGTSTSNDTFEESTTTSTTQRPLQRTTSRTTTRQPHHDNNGGNGNGYGGTNNNNHGGNGYNGINGGNGNTGNEYGGNRNGCRPCTTPPLTVSQPTVTDIHHHHHHYLPNFTNCMPFPGQAGGSTTGSFSGTDGGTTASSATDNSARDVDLSGVNTKIDDLYSEIEHLKTKINHLNDIVTDLMKQTTDVGTKLILSGVHVDPGTNLFELVRRILLDKLLLKDLRNDIYSATRTKDGVVFDVANALDKRRILAKAKEYLGDEDFKILDYYVEDGVKNKSDADIPNVDVRFGEEDEGTNDEDDEDDNDDNDPEE